MFTQILENICAIWAIQHNKSPENTNSFREIDVYHLYQFLELKVKLMIKLVQKMYPQIQYTDIVFKWKDIQHTQYLLCRMKTWESVVN